MLRQYHHLVNSSLCRQRRDLAIIIKPASGLHVLHERDVGLGQGNGPRRCGAYPAVTCTQVHAC
jgi:hypothetical protein